MGLGWFSFVLILIIYRELFELEGKSFVVIAIKYHTLKSNVRKGAIRFFINDDVKKLIWSIYRFIKFELIIIIIKCIVKRFSRTKWK